MKTLQTLTVLAGILNDPLIQAYSQEDAISFLRKLYERGAEEGVCCVSCKCRSDQCERVFARLRRREKFLGVCPKGVS